MVREPGRPRLSHSEREKILRSNERQWQLYDRRRRLYNRRYRRSLFFVSIWVARILFLLFMGYIFFFDGGYGSTRKEVVLLSETSTYMTRGYKNRTVVAYQLNFKTNKDDYLVRFEWQSPPSVQVGDTVLIERNLFNKPTFFSHYGTHMKYPLALNWVGYVLVLLVLAISFCFNDGLDRWTDLVLLIAWTSILVSVFCYLVG